MTDTLPPPGEHLLGISDSTIEILARDMLASISLDLAAKTRRTLDIVSRHLDPLLYDNDSFAAAVKYIALNNRHARIRLFIIDTRPLVSHGHRLLGLAQRLPDFIAVRVPAPQHRNFNEAFLVADNQGYVHRQFADRHEATANFADRRIANALSDRLNELWELGQLDPNFRRLHV